MTLRALLFTYQQLAGKQQHALTSIGRL